MSESIEELMRRRARLASLQDPSEVVVVRPKVTAPDFFGTAVSALIGVFARGGLVSWAAGHVGAVPDFGYVESVFLVLLVGWLLPGSHGRGWTRPWNQRIRAEYDRASAALRRAMKRGVDAAAKASEHS